MQTLTVAEFKKRYDVNFRAKKGDKDFIGAGGYGEVYLGYSYQRNHAVAIKKSPTKNDLLKEVEMARVIPNHPNIARYIEGFRIDTMADDFDVAILQYYEKGNLDVLMANVSPLTNTQMYQLVLGILTGLEFLHNGFKDSNGKTMHIIHRDLKPQNILISEYQGLYIPLITDFGISKVVINDQNNVFDNSNPAGTIAYKAPEQIQNGKIKTNLDLWAFGVLLFKILKGYAPFRSSISPVTNPDSYYAEIRNQIINADFNEVFEEIKNQPAVYQKLIKRCLVRDIDKRAQTAQELINILQDNVASDQPTNKAPVPPKPRPNPVPPPRPNPVPPTNDEYFGPDDIDSADRYDIVDMPVKVKPESNRLKIVAVVVGISLFGWIGFKKLAGGKSSQTTTTTAAFDANALFETTKTAFLEQGLSKTTALKQFRVAVAAKPDLKNKVRQLFLKKANSLNEIDPDLGAEYTRLADQFK